MKDAPLAKGLVVMTVASHSVYLSLSVFHSLLCVLIFYYLVSCLILPTVDGIVFRGCRLKGFAESLGFNRAHLRTSLWVGFGHGALFFALTIGSYLLHKDASFLIPIKPIIRSWGILYHHQWMLTAFMILFNGVVEEIFWRGYALGLVKDHWPSWVAILVVTGFYSSYHLVTTFSFFRYSPVSFAFIAGIFGAGLIWGWMRIRFNSIWAPVIGHSLATLGYMLVFTQI